jgi:transcriptional regulator with XRE-family HTH domain
MDAWGQREFFRRAVKEHQARTGATHADIAEALGLAKTSFRGILYQKGVRPSLTVLQKASAFFGISINKFISDPDTTHYDHTDLCAVPRFRLNGNPVGENEAPYGEAYLVDNARIRALNVNPMNLRYFDIDGDSMEPCFCENDRVFVDLGAFGSGFRAGAWVIRAGDAVMVKRVQVIGCNRYQASSDNPAYSPFMLEETCQLLGRVVALERNF